MSSVLKKGAAAWLLALTLSPFTAPFPTCDLATFMAGCAGHEPLSSASVTTSRSDATISQVVGIRRHVERLKLIALFRSPASETLANRFAGVLDRLGASRRGQPSSPHQAILRI